MSNAREKTLKAVITCLKEKTLMQIDAHEEDAGFIKMLSQSLFRHWVELESILKQYIKKPLPAKEQTTQIILQLGAAELRYMQTPAYAAISEWVELSKKYANKYQSGLVNAVLRKVSNHPTNQTEEQHFFPTSFLKILKQDYSKEQIESMEKAAQKSEPPLNITVKDNPQDWAEKLGGRIITGNSLVLTSMTMACPDCAPNSSSLFSMIDVTSACKVLSMVDVSTVRPCLVVQADKAKLMAMNVTVVFICVFIWMYKYRELFSDSPL